MAEILTFKRPIEIDRALIEKRLSAAGNRIFTARAIASAARARVCDLPGGDGSDADYCLAHVCQILDDVAGKDLCLVLAAAEPIDATLEMQS